MKQRIVIGLSGASGAAICVDLLRTLRALACWEVHLVSSPAGERVLWEECGMTPAELDALADVRHECGNIGASIASGTFPVQGMIVAPCSMKTLSAIACGYADTLLARAADVTLKEGRRLVLCPRETPLNAIHLRHMADLAALGVIMVPPMLTFYNHPQTIADMTHHVVGKLLAPFGAVPDDFRRWTGSREQMS